MKRNGLRERKRCETMSEFILQVPYGTHDVLPGEATARHLLADKIYRLFSAWGYDEVETPSFEYLETFMETGQSSAGAFNLFDRAGRALILRTDMTTPLARMVATRMKKDAGIKRLSYQARLFRYEEAQAGRQCEFTQCGIEMMGASGAVADAEVIALAINTLLETGLQDFSISLGQMEFINGLMEEAGLSEAQSRAVKYCLIRRNAVGLAELVEEAKVETKFAGLLKELLFLHGGIELLETLAKQNLGKRCDYALNNLREIYELVRAYDVASYLSFDLGLIRSLDYYTGMLFEGYAPGMGYSLIGGGRYDTMMERFGYPCPATGFALGIDRIVLTLERQGRLTGGNTPTTFIAFSKGQAASAILLTNQLRRQGVRIKLADRPMGRAEAVEESKMLRCETFRYVGD